MNSRTDRSRPDPYAGFAKRIDDLADAPQPFRSAMIAAIPPRESLQFAILSPALQAASTPASLLGITQTGWILVTDNGTTIQSTFRDTLAIEWSRSLLLGQLRILFIGNEVIEVAEIDCNAVMARLYLRAIQELLDGIDVVDQPPAESEAVSPRLRAGLKSIPSLFANAILSLCYSFRPLDDFVYWDPVLKARFGAEHESVVASALVRTSRELLWISREKLQFRKALRHGVVVVFCPRSRLSSFEVLPQSEMNNLVLRIAGPYASHDIAVPFPLGLEGEVKGFMDNFTGSMR